MGHGSNDKLYITHTEYTGVLGAHSSSSGFKAKPQAPFAGAATPFDCCALSFQPFNNPVCARNEDGTGSVFELLNIIPWLKQHNNKHPTTGASLTPADLISLNYSRKASGQIHDPISFKPFNEHSHIIAVATTGNVFLAESIKSSRDLLEDKPFKKEDLIVLQDPHGLSTLKELRASGRPVTQDHGASSSAAGRKDENEIQKPAAGTSLQKKKEDVPWNMSPYSTGLPGASLTSTSIDPLTEAAPALWDEEELMFDEIANPPKGKGKEKDVGKRRAYVRVVTNLGGGSLNLELYCEKAPKTCYNFLMLAREGKYDNCIFHRLIPGFMIQTGDPTGTGTGGASHWGTPFRDEYDNKGAAKHDSRGMLAMANKGVETNGSQWYITFKPAPHLDGKHTIFGKLVGGENVLDALEGTPCKPGTERPARVIKITEVVIYKDPFEEYKQRLAKKLAHKAEQNNPQAVAKEKRESDGVNWFGVKVGSSQPTKGTTRAGGVGKYISVKRPLEAAADGEERKKQRKLGFGNFEQW